MFEIKPTYNMTFTNPPFVEVDKKTIVFSVKMHDKRLVRFGSSFKRNVVIFYSILFMTYYRIVCNTENFDLYNE